MDAQITWIRHLINFPIDYKDQFPPEFGPCSPLDLPLVRGRPLTIDETIQQIGGQ